MIKKRVVADQSQSFGTWLPALSAHVMEPLFHSMLRDRFSVPLGRVVDVVDQALEHVVAVQKCSAVSAC